jgi:hypothetical protein
MKIGARVAGALPLREPPHLDLVRFLTHSFYLYRADMVCHWEDTDVVAQEMYYNVCVYMVIILIVARPDVPFVISQKDSLICVCIALAIA